MLLTSDEHCFGRLPSHGSYQIDSFAVSGNHCKIYRKQLTAGDEANTSSSDVSVFLEDTRLVNLSPFFVCAIRFLHSCKI